MRRKERNKLDNLFASKTTKKLTVLERRLAHEKAHPSKDKKETGVVWSKPTKRVKELKQFYKENTWAGIGVGWVSLGEEE